MPCEVARACSHYGSRLRCASQSRDLAWGDWSSRNKCQLALSARIALLALLDPFHFRSDCNRFTSIKARPVPIPAFLTETESFTNASEFLAQVIADRRPVIQFFGRLRIDALRVRRAPWGRLLRIQIREYLQPANRRSLKENCDAAPLGLGKKGLLELRIRTNRRKSW